MTDGVGSETYSYDNLGRTTQLQKVVGSTTYTTSYQYNLASELTQITYPSQRAVQQSYDAIGRLSQILDSANTYASSFGYNTAFQVTGFNYGNGVTASFGYSPDRLQLTSLSYTKGTQTLFGLSYSYAQSGGNNGQVAGITDSVDSGRNATYTYDPLARLATAVTQGSAGYSQWGLSFAYDRYGNRTAQSVTAGTAPSNSVTIDATKNRISGTPYSYDASGNMTNDGLNTLTYDAENRLVTSSGSLGSGTYSYDGNSLRVQKVSGGTTTVYIFSGTKVIAEYQNGAAPSSPAREYIYSGDQLLAKVEGGATNYYHADHLSVRVTTDANGNVVGQQGHYPFGESWYAASTTTKWQFTSYERDSESLNNYAMFRYNLNRLGRFSSPDLLAGSAVDPQSLNRYAYTLNDPLNLVDPLGLTDRNPAFAPNIDRSLLNDWLFEAFILAAEGAGLSPFNQLYGSFPFVGGGPYWSNGEWMLSNLGPGALFDLWWFFSSDPSDTGGAGAPGKKKCVGKARVIGPGKLTNGKPGGAFNVVVGPGSAAVAPAQFGLSKSRLKPFIGGIVGFIGPNSQVPTFVGVTDVIGPPARQQKLLAQNSNLFLVELEGGRDMGVQPITLLVPPGAPCPHGTTEVQ